ncbi:MAG: 16S rRNA (cytosine(1402)-N(4))-methyltransferase RsmH [Bacteroidetes bacterium]|nr:16S rRNA (cytosine(1402)-N(4))-methyltransferase RsmH [Rhodothermia bacterium]MCS7155861.1 16S rRNA (cytosine(1402)-N(4))-methyltransferase RsmH [Bacteroidota bacterium]MCX7906038.1 16S rRNA (cytosine(1402)-N(4))-methyltransferase RsmH [Bacteroidota bacterium]MDW8138166.1 16S rRNA (cytosine(1402)-N(4))-methyltransferase RsmH [Bacteroidota bacterium]MDW8285850.1 16S rRNA (cytosine(1402)-N(4))-methyltransferase RsmH [Bacteroidota bacterium]
MNSLEYRHEPVLLEAVLEHLLTDPDGVYLDVTLGGGGHAYGILSRLGPRGRLIGLDRDAEAIRAASGRLASFRGRVGMLQGDFAEIDRHLARMGVERLDGVLADLGLSSRFVDAPERGFSFRYAGPLDMRMDRRSPRTAAHVVNTYDLQRLGRILWRYGQEPRARQIAQAIVRARPLSDTVALRRAVESVVPEPERPQALARVFQAIRIEVNDELGALERFLTAIPSWVRPGGRLVVISYHSLEDRLVKRFMQYGNPSGRPVRDLYGRLLRPWRMLTDKPIRADGGELARNPRARSARMRVAERTEAP